MKKICILIPLLSFILASCSTPLKISMNRTTAEGDRYVVTSDQRLFHAAKGNMDIAMGTKISGKDTVLAFVLTCDADSDHGIFDEGNKFMFRLSDGSEISLSNLYDKEYEKDEGTSVSQQYQTDYGYSYSYSPWTDDIYISPFEVTRLVPRINHYKTTKSYALYLVTPKQLTDIITKGVKKVRVEIENKDIDMTDTENVAPLISKLYECLKGGLSKELRSEF